MKKSKSKLQSKPQSQSQSKMQISAKLRGSRISHGGLDLCLEQLCRNVLVSGQGGSGKTLSVVNPLAVEICRLNPAAQTKAACLYINAKGQGFEGFIEKLPERRCSDVCRFGANSKYRLLLWPDTGTTDPLSLGRSAASFIPELGRLLISTDDRHGNHKVFFEGLVETFLLVAADLWAKARKICPKASFACDSALFGVTLTAQEMAAHLSANKELKQSTDLAKCGLAGEIRARINKNPPGDAALSGHEQAKLIEVLRGRLNELTTEILPDNASSAHAIRDVNSILRKAADWLAPEPGEIKADESEDERRDEFQFLLNKLSSSYLGRLNRSIEPICKNNRNNSYFETVMGTINTVISKLNAPNLGKVLARWNGPQVTTLEQMLDGGEIFVLDVTDLQESQRVAAALVVQYFCNTVTNRLNIRMPAPQSRTKRKSRPMNDRRPVLLFADEFHLYAGSGRSSGLPHFLTISREFGCIVVLATQSLSAVVRAMGGYTEADLLLGNLATRIFGANTNQTTNNKAMELCGTGEVVLPRRHGLVFFASDRAKDILEAKVTTIDVLVPAPRFAALQSGQFIVRRYDGEVGFWNLRWDQKKEFRRIGKSSPE